MPNQPAPATDEERLKATLWHRTGTLADAALAALGSNATPQFIGALTELLWHQIHNASRDVEAFARHADRTIVESPDVLLLARRNEELERVLSAHVEAFRRGAT